MLKELLEFGQQVATLNKTISDFEKSIQRIDFKLDHHSERIIKLEAREESLVEKAKYAVTLSVASFSNNLVERITRIETKLSMEPIRLIDK